MDASCTRERRVSGGAAEGARARGAGGTDRALVSAGVQQLQQRVGVAAVLAGVLQLLDAGDERVHAVVDELVGRLVVLCNSGGVSGCVWGGGV